jgi:hypothetical protein
LAIAIGKIENIMIGHLFLSHLIPVASPPAVAEEPDNSQGHESEIKNAGVQTFSGFFAQLLSRLGADRALSIRGARNGYGKKQH